MRARFIWISELIAEYGLQNVGRPYIKHIENALWEIRMKGKDGISRALYVTAKPQQSAGCHCPSIYQKDPENAT